jgi:guanine nucleotide-binding protein subunit alpha
MRVIHEVSFSPYEVEHYRQVIFDNLTRGIRYVLEAMKDMELAVQSDNLPYTEIIDHAAMLQDGDAYPPEYCEPLKRLWNDPNVQTVLQRGNEAALPEK